MVGKNKAKHPVKQNPQGRGARTGASKAPLVSKLQIKPGMRVTVTGAPPSFPPLAGGDGKHGEATLAFVTSKKDAVARAKRWAARFRSGDMLWLAYPKGGSAVPTDLTREILWQSLVPLGLRPARQIAVDEVWTAMRFTPSR